MSLCLTSSHSFGYPLCNFFLLCSANLVQIHAFRHQLFQHLPHEVLVHVFRVEVGGAQQRTQAGLVFNGPGRYNGSGWRCAGRVLAGRAPFVPGPTRLPTRVATSLPPPALPRGFQTGPAAARYAHVSQTQLLGLLEHALIDVIALIAPSELGQHIVARLVLVAVCRLLLGTLASLGIRF